MNTQHRLNAFWVRTLFFNDELEWSSGLTVREDPWTHSPVKLGELIFKKQPYKVNGNGPKGTQQMKRHLLHKIY